MNVAPSAVLATEPVNSEGIVAAGAYVDGRRVANIAIDEASSWRSRPGHVVWIGLHEPDIALLTSVQRQFQLPNQIGQEKNRTFKERYNHEIAPSVVALNLPRQLAHSFFQMRC